MNRPTTRPATTAILEQMDEGILDPRTVANACLAFMSEAEILAMAEAEGILTDWDEDEDDETDEGEDEAAGAEHIPADPAEQPIERVKGRVKTVLRVHLVMQFNRISTSCDAADEIVSAIGADMDAVRIGYDASEFWIDEVEAVEAETFDGDEDEAIEQEAQS
jgi:hypothetical protein